MTLKRQETERSEFGAVLTVSCAFSAFMEEKVLEQRA